MIPLPVHARRSSLEAKRIGRAIALALVRDGYAVAVHARHSRDEAEGLCAEIVGIGGRAAALYADLRNHGDIQRLVPRTTAAVGPLTLLVNNAGVFEPDEIFDRDRAGFDRHFAVNLSAPVFLAKAFAAHVPSDIVASIVNLTDQRR